MKKKIVSGIMLTLVLLSMSTLALNIQPVKASVTYYIRADGSVDPSTAPIQRDGDIYTLTRFTFGEMIVVERDNIVVDGAGCEMEYGIGPGIDLSYRNNVTVKGMTFNFFKYGIYLNHSSNNTLCGNRAFDCKYGIVLYSSCNNVLSGNTASNYLDGDYGILLEYSSNNTLIGNAVRSFYYYPPGGVYGIYGIRLVHSCNNVLSGNTVSDRDYGIVLYSSCNNILSGNTVSTGIYENVDIYGIWLEYSNNNTLNDNAHYSYNSLWCLYGIYLVHSNNNILSGNGAWNNFAGIDLHRSCNNVLSGNKVSRNLDGISLGGSNNILIGNKASRNQYGIFLGGSNNTLIGNNASRNEDGIFLGGSNNALIGNTAYNNDHGIYFYRSSYNNVLSGNTISNNDYGIWLERASNNVLFHNNLINNGIQVRAYPFGYVNTWDNGYPSGGNYWSDYTGKDQKRGPNQDEGGRDGIVDEPYIIDDDNRDNYPLVEPWSPKPQVDLEELIETIKTWNLPAGTENSLTSKLEETIHLLNKRNDNGAVHKLMDFINQVEVLRDKGKLENWQADYLISETQRIIDLIKG